MARYDAYVKAAEQFTFSQALLTDKKNAASEIDRVLVDCMTVVYSLTPTPTTITDI